MPRYRPLFAAPPAVLLAAICAAVVGAAHTGPLPLGSALASKVVGDAGATAPGASASAGVSINGSSTVPTPGLPQPSDPPVSLPSPSGGQPWVTLPGVPPTPAPGAVGGLVQAIAAIPPGSVPALVAGDVQRNLAAPPPTNVPGLLEYLHENTSRAGSGLGVSDPQVSVPSPLGGRWSLTGSLSVARGGASTTALKDGRVLVAGGFDGSGAVATCELFDPQTGVWSRTGDLATARGGQTAVLLSDGRVVVIGGYGNGPGPLYSVEIFDPASGTWSSGVFRVTFGLVGGFAVALPDGWVLVGGGYDTNGALARNVELYNFSNGSTMLTGPLGQGRADATATLLPDGSVMVAGGYAYIDGGLTVLASTEIYSPYHMSWTPGPPMSLARYGHTATLLTPSVPDSLTGRREVVITGGTDGYNALTSAEVYDLATRTWERVGDLHQGHYAGTATALADGRLVVMGGETFTANTWAIVGSTEIFDPVTGQWAIGASMNVARAGQGAVQLGDGRVLAAGGFVAGPAGNGRTNTSELLTLPT